MFATIRRYRTDCCRHELAHRIASGFVPLMASQPGFVAYFSIDGGNGHVASVSVFATREQALESNIHAALWVRSHLADLLPEPPQVTAGEVIAWQGTDAPAAGRPTDRSREMNAASI